MSTPEGMVTVQEAARILGRSIEQVRRYLREGRLPGWRIGHQWFIEAEALSAWSRQRATGDKRAALWERINSRRQRIGQRLGRSFILESVMDEARKGLA